MLIWDVLQSNQDLKIVNQQLLQLKQDQVQSSAEPHRAEEFLHAANQKVLSLQEKCQGLDLEKQRSTTLMQQVSECCVKLSRQFWHSAELHLTEVVAFSDE